jgi:hypothetical protein
MSIPIERVYTSRMRGEKTLRELEGRGETGEKNDSLRYATAI